MRQAVGIIGATAQMRPPLIVPIDDGDPQKPSPRSRRRSLTQRGERRGVAGVASIPLVSPSEPPRAASYLRIHETGNKGIPQSGKACGRERLTMPDKVAYAPSVRRARDRRDPHDRSVDRRQKRQREPPAAAGGGQIAGECLGGYSAVRCCPRWGPAAGGRSSRYSMTVGQSQSRNR
jgi:hypothetical protein